MYQSQETTLRTLRMILNISRTNRYSRPPPPHPSIFFRPAHTDWVHFRFIRDVYYAQLFFLSYLPQRTLRLLKKNSNQQLCLFIKHLRSQNDNFLWLRYKKSRKTQFTTPSLYSSPFRTPQISPLSISQSRSTFSSSPIIPLSADTQKSDSTPLLRRIQLFCLFFNYYTVHMTSTLLWTKK